MKTFFNSKSNRERMLLTAFLLFVLLWWGSTLLERVHHVQVDWQGTTKQTRDQKTWLGKKGQIAERTAKISSTQLDPARTLNATQAFAEVNRLTQGLSVEIGQPRTDRTENIAMHNLQTTIRRSDWKSLVGFYLQLSQRAPYLGVEHCSISSERAAPDQITAVFKIYSVEVLRTPTP